MHLFFFRSLLEPVTDGGLWPAFLGQSLPPVDAKVAWSTIVALVGMMVVALIWKAFTKKEAPHRIEQPVIIEAKAVYVLREDFDRVMHAIEGRLSGLDVQAKEGLQKVDAYIHEMRHEVRGQLQSITSAAELRRQETHDELAKMGQVSEQRIVEVHNRVNVVVEKVGEVRGEIRHLSSGMDKLLARATQG